MILRQLFDHETFTYTYLLGDEETREAVLIDAVLEHAGRDVQLIKELGLKLKYLIETHVHADHITGVALIKESLPGVKAVYNEHAGVACPDMLVKDGDELSFGSYTLKVLYTPGHTDACTSFHVDGMVFTGDALLIRGCGRTDFQQGDPGKLFDGVTAKIFSLPDDTVVYPGHDYNGHTRSTVAEEKSFNHRFAGKTRQEFIDMMNNFKFPYPKKIDVSLPANLQCGHVQELRAKAG